MADNKLLEFSDFGGFSLPIEFIFKAVIGQYNFRTIFLHSHWRKQCTDIQRERKRVDYRLKLKVSTVDIRIKQSGLKVIHSKVPSSALVNFKYF